MQNIDVKYNDDKQLLKKRWKSDNDNFDNKYIILVDK